MQHWVLPLRRQCRPETISEESWEWEAGQPPFVWRWLANLFLHKFGNDSMMELLGSVLCDLPKDAFDKILATYPIFILARSAGFAQKFHAPGDTTVVIFTASELAQMNWSERRATVAHELAHVVAGHLDQPFSLDDPFLHRQQKEADDLCREWGFKIDAVRKYLERRKENGE